MTHFMMRAVCSGTDFGSFCIVANLLQPQIGGSHSKRNWCFFTANDHVLHAEA